MPHHRARRRPHKPVQDVLEDINAAVQVVRKSLDATRNPRRLHDVPHTYDDKYRVVELATQAALATQLNTLTAGFGLSAEKLATLQATRGKQTVTLRFTCSSTCVLKSRRKREEEAATRTEKKSVFGKTTYTSVTTYTDFFWNYTVNWRLDAVLGASDDGAVPLVERTGRHVFVTTVEGEPDQPICPLDAQRTFEPHTVEITWLLDACGGDGNDNNTVTFSIDRSNPATCCTPRRNPEVDAMLGHRDRFSHWCGNVETTLSRAYRDGYENPLPDGVPTPNFDVIEANVFVPVAAMLAVEDADAEEVEGGGGGGGGASGASPAKPFSAADLGAILDQQQAELGAKFEQIREVCVL